MVRKIRIFTKKEEENVIEVDFAVSAKEFAEREEMQHQEMDSWRERLAFNLEAIAQRIRGGEYLDVNSSDIDVVVLLPDGNETCGSILEARETCQGIVECVDPEKIDNYMSWGLYVPMEAVSILDTEDGGSAATMEEFLMEEDTEE